MLLLDINPCFPPVYPLGLEVLAQAVRNEGHEVAVLSASPHLSDYADQIQELENYRPRCIGLQIRNHDLGIMGLGWPKIHDFYRHVVAHLRGAFPGVPIIFGGAGFSIAPEYWLANYRPDYGVVGAGERALIQLLELILQGKSGTEGIPNATRLGGDGPLRCRRHYPKRLRAIERSQQGLARWITQTQSTAMPIPWANIEVQRGCPRRCRFCVEPAIHGRRLVSKPVADVLLELHSLLNSGVREVFFCASEFNADKQYSLALCRAIASAGIDRELRWSTYLCPLELDCELVAAMQSAGCRSVSINAVHASDEVLLALRCPHRVCDLESAMACLSNRDIDCRLTFLVGAVAETDATLESLFDFVRRHRYTSTITAGLACYPGLTLGNGVRRRAVQASPVPYAIGLSVDQLLLLEGFISETEHVRLANQDIRNVIEAMDEG